MSFKPKSTPNNLPSLEDIVEQLGFAMDENTQEIYIEKWESMANDKTRSKKDRRFYQSLANKMLANMENPTIKHSLYKKKILDDEACIVAHELQTENEDIVLKNLV